MEMILAQDLEVGMTVVNQCGRKFKIGKLGRSEHSGAIKIFNTRGKLMNCAGKKVKFYLPL